MENMNKAMLVSEVAKKTELPKNKAHEVVDALTESITAALAKGEKVQILGFGTFEVSERAGRIGRNPQTGESIEIAASKSPKFKAGKALKAAIQ